MYDLSVPLRWLFPFVNSKASPSDYIYSSEPKPGKNEPFHYKTALTDTSNINLLMTEWHCLKFTAADFYQNSSFKSKNSILVKTFMLQGMLYAKKYES